MEKALRMILRQMWEKIERRAKKDNLQALEQRVGRLEATVARLEQENRDLRAGRGA